MRKQVLILQTIVIAVLLSGCAAAPVALSHTSITPEIFTDNGVVIGQITNVAVDKRLGHKGEFFVGQMSGSSPEIFGTPSSSSGYPPRVDSIADKSGYIDFAYPAGQYTIKEFLEINGASTTRYTVNYNFAVNNGEITNIGHILLLFDPKISGRYQIFIVDNEKKMEEYIKQNYPEQYTSLGGAYTVKPLGGIQKITADQALSIVEKTYGSIDPSIKERF